MPEITTVAIQESKPPRWTEFFAVLGFIVTALAALLGSLNGANVGNIFRNSIGNISDKYYTEVTPSSYVFATIWPIIFLWTITGSLYLVVTIFLAKERSPIKMDPALTPLLYFVFYTVAFAATNCWYFAFDHENLDWSFILLAIAAIFTYLAVMITLKRTCNHMEILQRRSKVTLWLVRILVQNGLCVFATWITLATSLGFTIVSSYVASPDLPYAMIRDSSGNQLVAMTSSVSLSILLAIVVGWFFVENFILEKYFRYIFTIYPVFIFAFSGLVTKLSESGSKNNLVLAAVNLSISINMFVLRIILWIRNFRIKRETKTVVVAG